MIGGEFNQLLIAFRGEIDPKKCHQKAARRENR